MASMSSTKSEETLEDVRTSGLLIVTDDAEQLQTLGLLSPVSSDGGSRRIHKRRLNRSSDEEHSDFPLDIRYDSPESQDAFTTIPVALISLETLEYLGLSHQRVQSLWEEWTSWPATGPRREVDIDDGGLSVSFIDFIVDHMHIVHNAHGEDDSAWRRSLNMYGIAQDLQDAIMDPTFKNLRLTADSLFWVRDTLQMRYAGLQDIQRASRTRSMAQIRGSGRHSQARSANVAPSGLWGVSTSVQTRGSQSVSGLQQQSTPGVSSTPWSLNMQVQLSSSIEHVVLYKGIDQGRITGLFDEQGCVTDLSRLLTVPPSDFGGFRSLFYFTDNRDIAEYYAAYAKRRANCESVVMIVVTIPKYQIDELFGEKGHDGENKKPRAYKLHYPSPQWNQLVWRSKKSQPFPKTLLKYRDAVLLVGSTSKGATDAFQALEHWEEIGESFLLRLPDRNGRVLNAIQYVFNPQEEGYEFLEKQKFEVFLFSPKEPARVQS